MRISEGLGPGAGEVASPRVGQGERSRLDLRVAEAQALGGAVSRRTGEGRLDRRGTAVEAQVAAEGQGVRTLFDQRARVTRHAGDGGEGSDALVLRLAVEGEAPGRVDAVTGVRRVPSAPVPREPNNTRRRITHHRP